MHSATGLRVAFVSSFAYREHARGIVTVAREHGWSMQLYSPAPDVPQMIADWNPQLTLVGADAWTQLPATTWTGHTVVGVNVDLSGAGLPSVVFDEAGAGVVAARHLLSRGLRSLASFGFGHHDWSLRRAGGFADEAVRLGATYVGWGDTPEPPPAVGDRRVEGLGKWLAGLPRPTGLLACCDAWGVLAARAAASVGLRVPEDLAIVGIDNDDLMCELCHPPLSSVAIPHLEIGRAAATLALRSFDHGAGAMPAASGPHVVPAAELVARRSSDVLAVEDQTVATVMSLIRDHAAVPLTVPGILRSVPCDRRRLEREFRRIVGRSMLAEIRRVHVEQAKTLLLSTDLSMPQVAARCGFANASLLSVAFRRETGTTPTVFRRQLRPR